MNPINFEFLQVRAVLLYTFSTASKSKGKEQNNVFKKIKKRLKNKKNVKNVKYVTKKRKKRFYIYARIF